MTKMEYLLRENFLFISVTVVYMLNFYKLNSETFLNIQLDTVFSNKKE